VNTDELREELQRLGRQPVPAPRPDFVEGLLTRIQLTEDLQVPAPIQLVPRQPWAKFRMVAAGAVAAALLAAVGLFSLFQGGSPSRGGVLSNSELHSQAVGEVTQTGTLKVSPDGDVSLAEHPDEPAPAGTYDAQCTADARIKSRDTGTITCKAGDKVNLTVENGQIISARSVGSSPSSSEVAVPSTEASGSNSASTSAAPGPSATSTSTSPTSAPATPPATAAAVPAPTTSTTPTTNAQPAGTTGATMPMASTFLLTQAPDSGDGTLTFTWPAYAPSADARYLVLRTTSNDATVDPAIPGYAKDGPSSPVVATLGHDVTSYTATFDGSDVPVDTPKVSYRVVVVDQQGKALATSSTLTLELRWEKLKPAGEPATTTSTAKPDPTPTTATTGAGTGVTSPSGPNTTTASTPANG
jgi:hypothetical protein